MDFDSQRDEDSDVVEFRVHADSSASAADVIAAACDFSERRTRIWPNVSARRYEVHAEGERFAEVTEAALQGLFWERSRYEWSSGGPVHQTVIESNGLLPGSTWELTATPAADGCRVEALFRRRFKPTPKGRFARLVNRRAGTLLSGATSAARSRRSNPKEARDGVGDVGVGDVGGELGEDSSGAGGLQRR